jgi:hypothetical protein
MNVRSCRSKNGERAITDQFEHVAAVLVNRRDDYIGIAVR